MNASPVSVSSEPGERILVCGVNWVGDSVMTMPALQAFRAAHPAAHISLLVKPGLMPLWKLHRVPNQIIPLSEGLGGTLRTARRIRGQNFSKAFVLPHSFRSALIPWLAGVPVRVGMPGHWRDFMLTDVVRPAGGPGRDHQAWEYIDLLTPSAKELAFPELVLPEEAVSAAHGRLATLVRPRVALMPGAARGPSKQWPPERFIELGRILSERKKSGIVVLGISREMGLCEKVAHGIGPAALNLAGKTSMPEWIALLKACDLVICNDSGGMHLAAAVGTPLVAVYGMTDPRKTGPIGRVCRIVQYDGPRSRDIGRDSPEARNSLESVSPEQVYGAALECLKP